MESKETIAPFTTDGCSGGMSWLYNNLFHKELPWRDVCVEHDKAYWQGGTKKERRDADIELMCGVAKSGYPIIGSLMYVAVRFGGHWIFPTPYRWGYGWKYPKMYTNN